MTMTTNSNCGTPGVGSRDIHCGVVRGKNSTGSIVIGPDGGRSMLRRKAGPGTGPWMGSAGR